MNPTENTIAIIGASASRSKYGNKAVRAYKDRGFVVYPVNPNHDTIESLRSYPSILDIPGRVETVSVYLPPAKTLTILEDIKEKNPDAVFFNPGSENEAVIQKAEELGLNALQACSIIAVGKTPGEYSGA